MVYSGADRKHADRIENYLQQRADFFGRPLPPEEYKKRHIDVLSHKHGSNSWKTEAKKQMRQADVVVFMQGQASEDSPNIRWEMETAFAMGKPVVVCPLEEYDLPEWMIKQDRQILITRKIAHGFFLPRFPFLSLSSKDVPMAKTYTLKQLKDRIDRFDAKEYDIFSDHFEEMLSAHREETVQQLFEQYKLYQQTSEALVSRRDAYNTFHLSINTALLTFTGVIIGWADFSVSGKTWVLIFTALAGFLFNLSWCRKLDQLKILNTAKMRMINSIEQQLPLKLYAEEYAIMKDDLNPWKYRNSSADEKSVPVCFNVLYGLVLIAFRLFLT